MPFKSKAQERWAFANNEPFAKKWAKITNQKTLPKKVKSKKKKKTKK